MRQAARTHAAMLLPVTLVLRRIGVMATSPQLLQLHGHGELPLIHDRQARLLRRDRNGYDHVSSLGAFAAAVVTGLAGTPTLLQHAQRAALRPAAPQQTESRLATAPPNEKLSDPDLSGQVSELRGAGSVAGTGDDTSTRIEIVLM